VGLNLCTKHRMSSLTPPTVGVSASGPFVGKLADSTGPRLSLALSFVLLLTGYLGIKAVYDASEDNTGPAGAGTLSALVLFELFSGIGSDTGYCAAMNAVMRGFPDRIVSSRSSKSIVYAHPSLGYREQLRQESSSLASDCRLSFFPRSHA
jgi:MFS family permease